MRWFFRWAFRLLILMVVLVIAAILLLDTIAREITEYRLRQQTGLEVKIGRMQVGLLDPRLSIENLVIYNSAEFGGSPFIELPELHLEYERSTLFSSKIHFKLIRINLARLNVVEDRNGRKNLDLLDKNSDLSSGPKNQKAAETNFPVIDTLNLTLGRATYMRMRDPARVEELKLDVRNQVFTKIKSDADLQGVWLVLLLKSDTPIFSDEGKHWQELLKPSQKKNPPIKSSP